LSYAEFHGTGFKLRFRDFAVFSLAPIRKWKAGDRIVRRRAKAVCCFVASDWEFARTAPPERIRRSLQTSDRWLRSARLLPLRAVTI